MYMHAGAGGWGRGAEKESVCFLIASKGPSALTNPRLFKGPKLGQEKWFTRNIWSYLTLRYMCVLPRVARVVWMHAQMSECMLWVFYRSYGSLQELSEPSWRVDYIAQVWCCCSEVFFSLNLRVLTSNSILPKLSIDRGHYPSAPMDQCIFLGSQK